MKITTLTPRDSFHRIHTYFVGSPYHPDGRTILYTKFRSLRDSAYVCLMDMETGEETVIAESDCRTYHNGAWAYFCDGGKKVLYQKVYDWVSPDKKNNVVVCHDLATGRETSFNGTIGLYFGNIGERYIEVDADFPVDEQEKMAIYTRNIDGTDKRIVATVHDMLAVHPNAKELRNSKATFRLGAQISPDNKRVVLFLVGRANTSIRDYIICDIDGSNPEFHGRIGGHILWHPDGRRILAHVRNSGSSFLEAVRGPDHEDLRHAFVGSYDTGNRRMTLLGDYRLPTDCAPHLAPSPDGTKVVFDLNRPDEMSILLYDFRKKEMRLLCTEKRDLNVEEKDKERMALLHGRKHYDVNAHPVFSHDSRRIVYNSCPDGQVTLRQITL